MAKLYFYFSAMNAGKSTVLLQSSYNYQERGMETLVYTPAFDNRFGQGLVASRIGLKADAIPFAANFNFYLDIEQRLQRPGHKIRCILVDEAQFLTKAQVDQLADAVDRLHVPALCYGLRTDFRGELFEGSARLLALADELNEIKTICHCGSKATMVLRIDKDGKPVKTGEQVEIGDNDRYVSVCRKHFMHNTP
jgi:thymidine kinase